MTCHSGISKCSLSFSMSLMRSHVVFSSKQAWGVLFPAPLWQREYLSLPKLNSSQDQTLSNIPDQIEQFGKSQDQKISYYWEKFLLQGHHARRQLAARKMLRKWIKFFIFILSLNMIVIENTGWNAMFLTHK